MELYIGAGSLLGFRHFFWRRAVGRRTAEVMALDVSIDTSESGIPVRPSVDQLIAALRDFREALSVALREGNATFTSELFSADHQARVLLKKFDLG